MITEVEAVYKIAIQ